MARLLRDGDHLLHALDPERDTATFLPVEDARLRSAGFLDGRTALSDRPALTLGGLAEAADVRTDTASPRRYVFHGAFCGSTLLARLLDHPGRTLVLREPNVLAALADRKLEAPGDARLRHWCDLAAESLFRPRRPGEIVVVKPSNWVNNLLPELCGSGADARAVFIESEPAEFLTAVFRGGGERLRFVAQAAWRLSRGDAADEALFDRAQRDGGASVRTGAYLAAVLHGLQRRRFAAARTQAGWGEANVIPRAALASDPLDAARRADAALALDLPGDDLRGATEAWAGRYAKDASVRYAAEDHAGADGEVQARFGEDIRAAGAWADAAGLGDG